MFYPHTPWCKNVTLLTYTGFRLTGGGSLNTESAKKKENDEITCDAKKVLLTGGPNDLLEQLNR